MPIQNTFKAMVVLKMLQLVKTTPITTLTLRMMHSRML